MSGIGVILNPFSKTYKNKPQKARRMGFIVGDKASCRATENLDDLRRVAEEFKSRDIDILAISGGDGTNHCTLTTFIHVYGEKTLPKIALLRGGTLNTVASDLGIRGSSETLLSNLLVRYHEDRPFETRDIMLTRINDQYGFIFGLGVIYNFMELYYKNGSPSPAHAAKTVIRGVASAIINGRLARKMFDRFDAEVVVNGKKWPFANYAALFTGSVKQLGLNACVYRFVIDHPEQFHALGFSLPSYAILPYLPYLCAGKKAPCPNMLEEPASLMTIKLEKPLCYTIDGDMKPELDYFEVACGPKLKVLV